MNFYERDNIRHLPPEFRPLTTWACLGWGFLFSLPAVGLIISLIFSFKSDNINRRSFARAALIVWLILLAAAAVCVLVFHLTPDHLRALIAPAAE